MFSKSVAKVGRITNGFLSSVRLFSSSRNLATAYYESALTERFYNEEQLQMQRSLRKVEEHFYFWSA